MNITSQDLFEFIDWIVEEPNPFVKHNGRWIQSCGNSTSWSTEELYELFLKQKHKNNESQSTET